MDEERGKYLEIAKQARYDTVGVVVPNQIIRSYVVATCRSIQMQVQDAESLEQLAEMHSSPSTELAGSDFERYMALVIGETELLKPPIPSLFMTPIICVSDKRLAEIIRELAPNNEEAIDNPFSFFNLYGFHTRPRKLPKQGANNDLRTMLGQAVADKTKFVGVIKHFPTDVERRLTKPPEPPRFNNLQNKLRPFHVAQIALQETGMFNHLIWRAVENMMNKATEKAESIISESYSGQEISAEMLESSIEEEVLSQLTLKEQKDLSMFIDHFYETNKDDEEGLIKIEEEVDVGIAHDPEANGFRSFRMGAFRIEKPREQYKGYLIGLQRFLDARHFYSDPNLNTPRISLPIGCGKDREAFWTTEFIPGPTLNETVELLNKAKEDHENTRLVGELRFKLIRQYSDMIAHWVTNTGATFFPKYKGPEMIEFYKSQIEHLPSDLETATTFEMDQSTKDLWAEISNTIHCINYQPGRIVRNSDASLNNGIVNIPHFRTDEDNAAEKLINVLTNAKESKDPTEESKRTVSDSKIAHTLYSVDNGYRWGHITEDIAQIVTMYESRFLWTNDSRRNQLFERFLERTGFNGSDTDPKYVESLRDDFDHMCFYRAARKLNLFCDYWKKHLKRTDGEYEPERKEHIRQNMIHYANLAKDLAFTLGEKLAVECKGANDESNISDATNLLAGSPELDPDISKQYLGLITRSRRNKAKNAIRYFAAHHYFSKISETLNEEGCLIQND